MRSGNRYAKFAAYIVLIALNLLSFYALFRAMQDDRSLPEGSAAGAVESQPEEGILRRLRQRFAASGKPVKDATSAVPAGSSTAPDVPKFSRTSFFFQTPYIGSIAVPETWEGKYATKESGQSIDFLYALPGEAGYPIFNISLMTRKEWDKLKTGKTELRVLKELPDQIFATKLYEADIADKSRAQEFSKMREEAKAVWNSFRSYAQPIN
jgi:hypothetical protein